MSCYTNMIVRVKYVKQYKKEDVNLLVVWALGTYSVKHEDYNIEMMLFLPISLDNRDFETQAVFKKDSFFSVDGKIVTVYYSTNHRIKMTVLTSTHVSIFNKVADSNKYSIASKSSIHSRLLVTHKNIVGNSKQKPKNRALTGSNNLMSSSDLNFADYSHLAKHCADYGSCTNEYNNSTDFNQKEIEGSVKNNDKCQEKPLCNKGKKYV
ncbi:9838_t:CDS:2, partial [Cetraspora pellucida]